MCYQLRKLVPLQSWKVIFSINYRSINSQQILRSAHVIFVNLTTIYLSNMEEMKMTRFNSEAFKVVIMIITLAGGMGLSAVANAERGMGYGGMKGGMGCGKGMYGACWKDTLTDEQRNKLAKIKLDHMKVQAPIKAKMKTIKVDLAMLVTADKPDTNAINKKIDELSKLKNAKMKEKYKYIAAKRKVLNAEQRVLFDMKVIKKAMKGKRKGHHRH